MSDVNTGLKAARWNTVAAVVIGGSLVMFGYSIERAAKQIGDGLDDFGYPHSGWLQSGDSDVKIPSSFTVKLENVDD